MNLLTPSALALSALAIPILLMYVLRLRRPPRTVSSTLLWHRALDDVQANAPWQRLRPSLLLLLQLLVLGAMILAVAGPAYSQGERFSGDVIVIVDESYGMQLSDVYPNRFSAALHDAQTLASRLAPGNVMSVVGMGNVPRLAITNSSDRGRIGRAISSLHLQGTTPNYLGALSLATSLARSGEGTRVVVLTSRESGITGVPFSVAIPVQIVRIGGNVADVGITGFVANASRSRTAAILHIHNFGSHPENTDIDLLVDGQLADVRPVSLRPGADSDQFWSDLPAGVHWLEAHLTSKDELTADKTAYAVVTGRDTRTVLLVSNGDYFLQTALSLDPSIRLRTADAAQYAPSLAAGADLVIFDGVLPNALGPVPTLLVDPPAGYVGGLSFGREYSPGQPAASPPAPGEDSIMQYVDLRDVQISRARALRAPAWLHPVAVGRGGVLLAAGESAGRRIAVISFSLAQSDWTLRVSFPVFVQNLVRFLTPGLSLGTTSVSLGGAVPLAPEGGVPALRVIRPDGQSETVHAPFGHYTHTDVPGIYTVAATAGHGGSTQFAVNSFHPGGTPAPGPPVLTFGRTGSSRAKSVSVPVSIAWTFGLAALALLTFEWWFAFRR